MDYQITTVVNFIPQQHQWRRFTRADRYENNHAIRKALTHMARSVGAPYFASLDREELSDDLLDMVRSSNPQAYTNYANLDYMPIWDNEVATLLRISGQTVISREAFLEMLTG